MKIENCTIADYHQIVTEIISFWGDDHTLKYHHTIYIHEFGNTAFVIKEGDRVAAYLFGFFSQTARTAYVHLVGVREDYQKQGLGKQLYEHFMEMAKQHNCEKLKAITSPTNGKSISFHTKKIGMVMVGEPNTEGVPVVKDYAGPGMDRVVFERFL